MLQARQTQVLSITSEIAALSAMDPGFNHYDPADRLIDATTTHHQGSLITSDQKLRQIHDLSIIG